MEPLTFIPEEIPRIHRPGGSGRAPEPWEKHLAPLKEEGVAGVSQRVWTYENKHSARARASAVQDRLFFTVPDENWTVAVRPVPGLTYTDSTGAELPMQGVYVVYNGTYTPEQIVARQKARQERSDNVKAARAEAKATREAHIAAMEKEMNIVDIGGENAGASPTSAKERATAVRKAAAK